MALNTILIAYDITENTRRARLASMLQVFGDRLQKSVFILHLTAPELDGLTTTITKTINPHTDSVAIYPLCTPCAHNPTHLGQQTHTNQLAPYILIN